MIEALKERVLVDYRATHKGAYLSTLKVRSRKLTNPLSLEELAHAVSAVEKHEDHEDIERELKLVQVKFIGRKAMGVIHDRHGRTTEMPFTESALRQYVGFVDNIRYGNMSKWCEQKSGRDITSALLTEQALKQVNRPVLVRTSLRAGAGRCIRSVHGSGSASSYTPYGNARLLKDLLSSIGELKNCIVASMKITDNYFRCRLFAPQKVAHTGEYIYHKPIDMELRIPVPVIDINNSATGHSALEILLAFLTLICTNGLAIPDIQTKWTRQHRGNTSRLRHGMLGAFESALAQTYGVANDIRAAHDIQVANLSQVTTRLLNEAAKRYDVVNDNFIGKVIGTGLNDPTTPQDNSIAQIVQATSLIAQTMRDVKRERMVEEMSHWILKRGLELGDEHGGRIPVVVGEA